jgi:hypothetical protein
LTAEYAGKLNMVGKILRGETEQQRLARAQREKARQERDTQRRMRKAVRVDTARCDSPLLWRASNSVFTCRCLISQL